VDGPMYRIRGAFCDVALYKLTFTFTVCYPAELCCCNFYKNSILCAEDGSASGGLGALERSEDSGSFLGGEADSIDSSGWSDTVGMSDVDQISAELANRGPQKSDLKLRYHLILFIYALLAYSTAQCSCVAVWLVTYVCFGKMAGQIKLLVGTCCPWN